MKSCGRIPRLTPASGRVWRRCCCWRRYWVLMGNIIKIHITRRGARRGAAPLHQAPGKHPGIFTISTSSGEHVNSSFGSSHSPVCYHDQLLSTLYRHCCVLCGSTEERVGRCTGTQGEARWRWLVQFIPDSILTKRQICFTCGCR